MLHVPDYLVARMTIKMVEKSKMEISTSEIPTIYKK